MRGTRVELFSRPLPQRMAQTPGQFGTIRLFMFSKKQQAEIQA
jgi:hypothetical protein